MSNPSYLCLALTMLFGLARGHTIISHPELMNPREAFCLEQICEDLSLVEFGLCDDNVILDKNLSREVMTVRFERILEAMEIAEERFNATNESVLMSLLVSEDNHIQGLTLFNSPEYLIDAIPVPGRHVVFPLYHQRYVHFERHKNNTAEENEEKNVPTEYEGEGENDLSEVNTTTPEENTWFFYLLFAMDYRYMPFDCHDPPTKFNINWILAGRCSILAVVKYNVNETNAPWNIKDPD